ncbi:hypothetical protein IFM89_024407, partial [Coptis chinensis]
KGRNAHVPYRDSKLTRILQPSLGGNARTAIICTISPAQSHVEQTRNTLLFASCAKEVATNAHVNVVISDKALMEKEIKEPTRQRDLAQSQLEDLLKVVGDDKASRHVAVIDKPTKSVPQNAWEDDNSLTEISGMTQSYGALELKLQDVQKTIDCLVNPYPEE